MSIKKAAALHSRAQQLIQQLDELAKDCEEVALCSSLGPIFSWQKNKLQNLELCLKNGFDVVGFIAMSGVDGPDEYCIRLLTVPETPDDVSVQKRTAR